MNQTTKWQRNLLAFFALTFLVVGTVIAATDWLPPGSQAFASGTLLKVGFVLGLAWVAAPQLERFGWERLRGSLLVGIIIVIVLWSIRPRIGAIAGAILALSTLGVTVLGWIRRSTKPRR